MQFNALVQLVQWGAEELGVLEKGKWIAVAPWSLIIAPYLGRPEVSGHY